jgi:hypothetical protein
MKTTLVSKSIFAAALIWSCHTLAGDSLYTDLQMKNFDEMEGQVKALVLSAQKVADDDVDSAKAKLKDALQLIFSRPNTDNMVSQLLPIPRTPLKNLEAYESTLRSIVKNCVEKMKDTSVKVSLRSTCYIVLDNVMGELKPDAKNNSQIRDLMIEIRDAKLKLHDDVKSNLRMHAMIKASVSPSETAKKIIGDAKR